jgi:hypothetical protein
MEGVMSFREAMRRVITGDTPEGKSVVVIDGPSSEIGDVLFEIWEDAAGGPLDPRVHADLGTRKPILGPADAALASGPQRIERRDSEPVVKIAESDWRRLVAEFESFADFVLNSPLEPEDVPERRLARRIGKAWG